MSVDLRVVSRYLGLLMLVQSVFVLLVAVFAITDYFVGHSVGSADIGALLATAGVGTAVGLGLLATGRGVAHVIGHREALLLVALTWIVGAILAALPFRLWAAWRANAHATAHSFDWFVNCYFEAMSGLTTTGASVVTQLEILPRSLLLWRAFTHWLGGGGIVILFVAVLPVLGVGGKRVFQRETTGLTKEGVTPRIQDTARLLWLIYTTLTLVEIVLLRFCGMGWFEATCHSFATIATGGFSTRNASIGAYDSSAIHLVIILFMVLSGINFGLYYQLYRGQWRTVVSDPELRAYFLILLSAAILVSMSIWARNQEEAAAVAAAEEVGAFRFVRDVLFSVVSINTTTGFCTADFDAWGFVAKCTLVIMMFSGACSGSTSGGIKIIRLVIAAKAVLAEIEHVYRPNVVRPTRVGPMTIAPELKLATFLFLLSFLFFFVIGTVGVRVFEDHQGVDIVTAATASVTTLSNVGPGLGGVGPARNYAWLSAPSKLLLSMLMLVGRLEIFTVVVLFTPRFWRSE